MKKSIFIRTGIIVSLTLAMFIWGLNFLKGRLMFKSQTYYYVIYDRIDGLEVSNSVLINGFKVGQVSDIHFMPDTSGRLVVQFNIAEQYKIPKNTVAQIFSSDLMGTKSIALNFGDSKELQQHGDTLIADFEGSLTEMVSVQMLPLKNKAEDLMKEMEEAISVVKFIFNKDSDLSASIVSIRKTFENLESSTVGIDSIISGGRYKIDKILANVESITTNLESNNEEITILLKNISSISDSVAKANIYQLVSDLNGVMKELNNTMYKIDAGEGTIGQLVNNDTLYYNLEDVTYNLNRLLEDFRLNPKRYVHFSAFDVGKTYYVNDEGDVVKKKEKTVYKIKIVTSNKSIPLLPENFNGYKNIEEASVNGIYIYMYSSTKKIDKARSTLEKIKVDFPDAQIVQISEGSYIEVD